MTTSKESFFSGSTTRLPPLPIRPRLTRPLRSHARCSSTSRSQTAASMEKSPTNCTPMMLPQKKRAPEGARLYSYDRRLEAVNHAHEEDADVGTRRRRHVLAALGARQATPREAGRLVVLDRRVAHAYGGALGKAIVVSKVPLLGAVIAGYVSAELRSTAVCLPTGQGRSAERGLRRGVGEGRVVALDIPRDRVRGPYGPLPDRNCGLNAPLSGLAVAVHGLVRHGFVGDTDVCEAEIPTADQADSRVRFAYAGELLVPVKAGTHAHLAAQAGP